MQITTLKLIWIREDNIIKGAWLYITRWPGFLQIFKCDAAAGWTARLEATQCISIRQLSLTEISISWIWEMTSVQGMSPVRKVTSPGLIKKNTPGARLSDLGNIEALIYTTDIVNFCIPIFCFWKCNLIVCAKCGTLLILDIRDFLTRKVYSLFLLFCYMCLKMCFK